MEMKKIAFFDTKPYDRESFDRLNNGRDSSDVGGVAARRRMRRGMRVRERRD